MDVAGQALAVLLVFALLAAAVRKLGRGGLGRPLSMWRSRADVPSRALETVERVALTPQHAVHLVRFHGRDLIVATHPQGCSLLLESGERSHKAET
jgi:flagellar biogenesis protein FliO